MCHPGRPGPHGESHVALSGSSAFAPFHRAKSRGSRLPRGSASSAGSIASMLCRVSSPYDGQDRMSKYTSAEPSVAAYACPASMRRAISSCICGMDAVARGSYVGAAMPIAA